MRTRVLVLSIVAVAGLLVWINLSLGESPEPEFSEEPAGASGSQRPAREVVLHGSEGTGPERAPAQAPVGTNGEQVDEEQEEQQTASTEVTAPVAEARPSAPGCAHPLVPSLVGTRRRYRWLQDDEGHRAILSLEAARAEALSSGVQEVVWEVVVSAEEDGSNLSAVEMRTRCTPDRNGEEPWFGIVEYSMGLSLNRSSGGSVAGRWRWPWSLAPGDEIGGRAVFDPEGSDMEAPAGSESGQMLTIEREHRVGEREQIIVEAGTFDAFSITYQERHTFGRGGESGTGTLWLAEGPGLVRSEFENSEGISQTLELLSMHDPS